MTDIGPVLVSVCGLLCVGAGLTLVIGFIIIRATGSTLFNAFDEIGGVAAALGLGQEEEAADTDLPRSTPGPRRDLRTRVQRDDFDAAISQYAPPSAQSSPPPSPRQDGPPAYRPQSYNTPVQPPAAPPPAAPRPDPFDDDDNPSLRRASGNTARRRRDSTDEDPDIFAAFLDDE